MRKGRGCPRPFADACLCVGGYACLCAASPSRTQPRLATPSQNPAAPRRTWQMVCRPRCRQDCDDGSSSGGSPAGACGAASGGSVGGTTRRWGGRSTFGNSVLSPVLGRFVALPPLRGWIGGMTVPIMSCAISDNSSRSLLPVGSGVEGVEPKSDARLSCSAAFLARSASLLATRAARHAATLAS